jgi:hypothetical protein
MAIPLPKGAVGVSTGNRAEAGNEEDLTLDEQIGEGIEEFTTNLAELPENLLTVSDDGELEFPNVPPATNISSVGFFESLIPNVEAMFVRDDFGKAEIIEKAFKGDKRFGGIYKDKYANPMLVWEGAPYYVNKPGFGLPDLGTFTGEIIKYLPATKFVSGAKNIAQTIARGLPTYSATETAGQALESVLTPETTRAKSKTAGDIAKESATAGVVGTGVDVLLPPVAKPIVQGVKAVTREGAKQARKVFPDFIPEKVLSKAVLQKSKYPLTQGQRTAPLPERGPTEKVTAQLEQEDVLRRAPSTDETASQIMRGFDEKQLDQIKADAGAIQREFGSGTMAGAADVPGAAAESIQNIGVAQSQALKERSKLAYQTVKEADMPPIMTREGILQTSKNIIDVITKGGDEGLGITARELADMPLLRRELEYLKKISKIAGNTRFKGQPLRVLHGYQKSLNRAARSAQQGSPEAMALNRIKGMVDSAVFDGIEQGIMVGDEAILQELKSATDLYKQYMGLVGKGSAKDSQERAANKILEMITNPNYTPVQVARALFGHAKFNPSQSMVLVINKLKNNLPDGTAEEVMALLKDGILEKAFSGSGKSGVTRTNIVNNYDDIFVKNKKIIDAIFTPQEVKTIQAFRQNVLPTLWSEIKLNPSGSGYTILSGLANKGLLNYARLVPILGSETVPAIEKMRSVSIARDAVRQQVNRMNRPLLSGAIQATVRPETVETMSRPYESRTLKDIVNDAPPSLLRKLEESATLIP